MTRRFAGISVVILIAGVAGAFALSPTNSNASPAAAAGADSDKSWIAKSNEYAGLLIEIDRDNFNEVMAKQSLAVAVTGPNKLAEGAAGGEMGVKLSFQRLGDFEPEGGVAGHGIQTVHDGGHIR